MAEIVIAGNDEAEMVRVEAGEFIYGISDEELTKLHRDPSAVDRYRKEFFELERQVLSLPEYLIDRFPVTNGQYRRYMSERSDVRRPRHMGSSIWGRDDTPVIGLNWEEAEAYATWAGKRLPTEEEWEKAARGTDGRLFPWGNSLEGTFCNCYEAGLESTSPAGSFPSSVSPSGALDMAGNVWEMTTGIWTGGARTMRGGSYLTYQRFCRVTARWAPATEEMERGPRWLGFRCVLVPGAAAPPD